jgi:membrane fusion protein, multidrug efflux system
MSRKAAFLAVLAVAVAGSGAFAVTGKSALVRHPPTPPTVPVVAGAVTAHDVPIYLRGVGTVIAYNTVVVRSQIQGQLTKIAFA